MPDVWREAEDYAHYCGEGPTDEPPQPEREDDDPGCQCGEGLSGGGPLKCDCPACVAEREARTRQHAQGDGDDGREWETGGDYSL